MRKILSVPFLKFKLYKDLEEGYSYRFGNNHRTKISLFNLVIISGMSILILLSIIGSVGYLGYKKINEEKVKVDARNYKDYLKYLAAQKKEDEEIAKKKAKEKSEEISNLRNRDTSEVMKNLEPFFPSPINTNNYSVVADKFLKDGSFNFPPYGYYQFGSNINWYNSDNPSYLRLVHAHFILIDLVNAYKETNNEVYLDKGMELIKDWVNKNPFDKTKMAWHDETTAERLMSWIYYFDAARKHLSDADIDFLLKNIQYHQDILSSDDFYTKNSNHGMYQDQALLVSSDYLSTLPGESKYRELCLQRLNDYFTNIYSKDGVHYENSPSYHILVSTSLKTFGDYLLKTTPKEGQSYIDLFNKTAKYSTFMLKPDGQQPQIGDASVGGVPSNLYDNQNYLYAATAGKMGVAPSETDAVFQDPGYAIFRDSWQLKDKATYLFFNAADKSNDHKHNDDLSLWLYSGGDVITEAGPYGYTYDDPFTQYGYSSFAHNTLIVDDKGLSNDTNFDGTKIVNYSLGLDVSSVTGINKRYKNVNQTRNIQFIKSKKTVIVSDNIDSKTNHKYQLLWHFAPDIQTVIQGNSVILSRNGTHIGTLNVASKSSLSLSLIKGQNSPVQGWYFQKYYQKTPTYVLTVDFTDKSTSVTTTIDLSK